VPALVRLLEGLEQGGYVEGVGPRRNAAATTEDVLTYEGLAEVKP
jgi:hypothetical protein